MTIMLRDTFHLPFQPHTCMILSSVLWHWPRIEWVDELHRALCKDEIKESSYSTELATPANKADQVQKRETLQQSREQNIFCTFSSFVTNDFFSPQPHPVIQIPVSTKSKLRWHTVPYKKHNKSNPQDNLEAKLPWAAEKPCVDLSLTTKRCQVSRKLSFLC